MNSEYFEHQKLLDCWILMPELCVAGRLEMLARKSDDDDDGHALRMCGLIYLLLIFFFSSLQAKHLNITKSTMERK